MIYVSKWIVIKFLLEVSTQLKYTDRDYTTKNSNPYWCHSAGPRPWCWAYIHSVVLWISLHATVPAELQIRANLLSLSDHMTTHLISSAHSSVSDSDTSSAHGSHHGCCRHHVVVVDSDLLFKEKKTVHSFLPKKQNCSRKRQRLVTPWNDIWALTKGFSELWMCHRRQLQTAELWSTL